MCQRYIFEGLGRNAPEASRSPINLSRKNHPQSFLEQIREVSLALDELQDCVPAVGSVEQIVEDSAMIEILQFKSIGNCMQAAKKTELT